MYASINVLLFALATPCIGDSLEPIFDKDFLGKFEGKIAKALTVLLGTCAEPICTIKSKNRSHYYVPVIFSRCMSR